MTSKGLNTPSSLSAIEQELLAAISSPSKPRGRAGTPSDPPSNGARGAPSSAPTRRRPRPEEHAATATATDRQAAFLSHRRRLERSQGGSSRQELPREEDRQAKALTKRGDSDELVGPWNRFFDEIDIQVTDKDWWGTNIYAKSQRGGTTVDGTEDSMDLEDEEEPPSADPDFPISQRWKQRGPEGPAKARWATARYQAKKRVKRTPAWLTATPEAREMMERTAADAIPFIPDAVPARPVPPRAMEPWLRSEREALLRIIDDNNRRPGPRNRLATVTESYNLRMEGINQKKGELCLAVGNGHSRRDSKLTEDRIAPVRTQGSVQGNMIKWINERAICDCRQYQRYLVGDFERSGDFPYDHAAGGCTPPDREDACKCLSYLRDYNGNLPDRHHSEYCG
ncbi:hypothetical protein EYC80_007705 [Monilinia laxa]|uniref:Uncharacterized protein n=1 Tax=Monilinia laxa TaxID=61186 RepID=A0A5N6JWU2_MONLA|nr:hypothetical protein EYC80_007705 [Monilinia laxa]